MKSRKNKITERDSKVAAEILTQFLFTKDMNDVINVYDRMYAAYNLCIDPFTHTPCSPGDYAKYKLEYDRQCMDELYGHHDGLE